MVKIAANKQLNRTANVPKIAFQFENGTTLHTGGSGIFAWNYLKRQILNSIEKRAHLKSPNDALPRGRFSSVPRIRGRSEKNRCKLCTEIRPETYAIARAFCGHLAFGIHQNRPANGIKLNKSFPPLSWRPYRASEFHFSVGSFECFWKPKLATLAVLRNLSWIFEECVTKLAPVFNYRDGAHLHRAIDRLQSTVCFHFVNESINYDMIFLIFFLFCLCLSSCDIYLRLEKSNSVTSDVTSNRSDAAYCE